MGARRQEHIEHAGENIARNGGRNKSDAPPEIHDGMTYKQKAMAGVGGLAHGVSVHETPDASSANPLDKEPPGKNLAPVKNAHGHDARTLSSASPNGATVLSEAVESGGTPLRAK